MVCLERFSGGHGRVFVETKSKTNCIILLPGLAEFLSENDFMHLDELAWASFLSNLPMN